MFDVSFAELVVVGIVALVVIGPEKLPAVARTAGYFIGRARRYVERVKHELREEVEFDDLRKLKNSVHEAAHSFENSIRTEINQVQREVTSHSTNSRTKKPHKTEQDTITEHDIQE